MSFGYLFLDHRASPGLTEDQARKAGYRPEQVREGSTFEADTKRCAHCATIVILNPLRERPRNKCFKCNDFICDNCAAAAVATGYTHCSFNELADNYLEAAIKGT